MYFIGQSDIAIKKSRSDLDKNLVVDENSICEEPIGKLDKIALNIQEMGRNKKRKKSKMQSEAELIFLNEERKANKKSGAYREFTSEYEIKVKGKSTKFQKPFLDRAFDSIDKLKARTAFVRYYNAIFIARIMLIIACLITLATTPILQVFVVMGSQATFTGLVIWYQYKLKFLSMNCFYTFNHLLQEIVLTIFLLGAQVLSFDDKRGFSEMVLLSLEFIMSLSLVLCILVEMIILVGAILSFGIEMGKLINKCFKKNTEKENNGEDLGKNIKK